MTLKICLVITNHSSQRIRPHGRELLNNAYNSFIKNCKYDYEIVLVDNQSDEILSEDSDILKNKKIHYIYIKNQWKRGITGAWNEGIKKASTLDCDIILNSNDDLVFNESINDFIEKINYNISKDVSIFGPLTDGVLGAYAKVQYSQTVDANKSKEIFLSSGDETRNIVEKYGLINGFFLGFTKKFYEKFRYSNGDLFAELNKFEKSYIDKYAAGCGKWCGQEIEILRFRENGGKVFLIGECWIHHLKKRDWLKLRELKDLHYSSVIQMK